MKYQDTVNKIKEIVEQHLILQEYGYGDLSDIKVKNQISGTEPNYPYLFVNPTIHNRNNNIMIYRFNLIVMDLCDEDYLKIQSECIEYIDDVIGRIKYYYRDFDINITNIQYAVFKERFQDSVAGATATIELNILSAIDNCITPFQTNIPD